MLSLSTSAGRSRAALVMAAAIVAAALLCLARPAAQAQDPATGEAGGPSASPAPAASDDAATPPPAVGGGTAPPPPGRPKEQISWVYLMLFQGGPLMIPIGIMSLLVLAVGIERFLGLRRRKVFPNELVEGLGRLAAAGGGFDPRKAYRLCQQYPSAAANVVRAMLLKVGRPHSEVEHAVAESSDREAARLYAMVRWLNLAAAVTPLLGLLGTVQGMILAFFQTTHLDPGLNKADFLAEGIYVALVTTLSGLMVAIPAAMLAHYFEGRIQSLFHQIDEMLFNLLPQVERYEGRVRFSRLSGEGEPAGDAAEPREPQAAAGTAQ